MALKRGFAPVVFDEDARDGTSLPGCMKIYIRRRKVRLASCTDSRKTKMGASISTILPSVSDTTRRGPPL